MKSFAIFLLMLLSGAGAFSQNHELAIIFKGVESPRGEIVIQVINEEDQVVASRAIPSQGKDGENVFTLSLASGLYAVNAFHDINSNGKLDKKSDGTPIEPHSFSNPIRRSHSQPQHQDQLVMMDRDERISLTLK